MDMLDYRIQFALMAADDRRDRLYRERRLLAELTRAQQVPLSSPNGRRRWSEFLGRIAAIMATGRNQDLARGKEEIHGHA